MAADSRSGIDKHADARNHRNDSAPVSAQEIQGKHGAKGTQSGAAAHATDAQSQKPQDPARKAYEAAQAAYQKELGTYWTNVEAAKHASRKVTQFPPFYKGPDKPANYDPPKEPSTLPSVNDMVHAWGILAPIAAGHPKRPNLPGLKLDEPTESAFKRAYARESLVVGRKHGLSKADTQNIVQNIYAFEDAGKGTADMLSGVPFRLTAPDAPGSHANRDERRSIHPLSTAMGYNQLLMATTVQFVDGSNAIDVRLKELAATDHGRATAINNKEHLFSEVKTVLHKELSNFAQTNKSKYLDGYGHPTDALYTDFARSAVVTGTGNLTGRQLSSAVQALNLDRDVGPVLQAQEIDLLLSHGLDKSFKSLLQQKEQDDLAASQAFGKFSAKDRADGVNELVDRAFPDSKGQPPSGTAADVIRAHLMSFSANESTPLTKDALGEPAFDLMVGKILAVKKYGDVAGPLEPTARALVDALFVKVMNHPSADSYLPAAVELANLAGTTNADDMLKSQNAFYPTVNFFDRGGYQANGITIGRTADELIKAIYRSMRGVNGSPQNYGMADMIRAFQSQ